MSTATTRKRKQPPADPLDPSDLVSPQSEKACLAGLVDIIDRNLTAFDEIVSGLTADMFLAEQTAAVFAALLEARNATSSPTMADIAAALRRQAAAAGIDYYRDDPARILLATLASRTVGTGPQAARLAAEAAAEVRETALRRQAILAARDAVARVRNGMATPQEIRDIGRRFDGLADIMDGRQGGTRQLVLTRASEIPCTPINWLWPQRIVGDGLTIVTGPVGISKSLISVDVAARVTTGGKWPDGTGHAPTGSVILFGAEDDAGKIVVPRLKAADADLDRVLVCQGTTEGGAADEPDAVVLERHIDQLRAALDAVADCRLVVFDPLPDYLAADENSSREVRAALMPLARLAQERNVAVVAVLHQNKKNDLTTVQRIAGSGAFAQIARIVLAIGTHPDDIDGGTEKRRVMLVSKSNYGQRDVGQAYEIETRSNSQPGIVWHPGTITIDADSLSRRPTGGNQHEERRGEAVDVLRELLADGEKSAAAIGEEMQDRGFGRRQITHATDSLNVVKRKHRDGWYWRLPAGKPRPAVTATATPDPAFAAWAPADDLEEYSRP